MIQLLGCISFIIFGGVVMLMLTGSSCLALFYAGRDSAKSPVVAVQLPIACSCLAKTFASPTL